MRHAALLAAALALMAGCAGRDAREDALIRELVTRTALAQVGRPYRAGGAAPESGFDCSGLVQYSYAQAGVPLPRSAAEQRKIGDDVDFDEARPGDLLFYKIDSWFGVDHVALYVGDGYAVHAPASGRAIVVTDMTTPFWREHFIEAVDVLD